MRRELRSTQAALELLDSFKLLRTRGNIQQLMLSKLLDILQQFGRELDSTLAVFNQHKVHRLARQCYAVLMKHLVSLRESDRPLVLLRNPILQSAVCHSLPFCIKIGRVRTIYSTSNFAAVQDKPPVARNQAPVSGAIRWSRSLFARCKRTYVLLNAVEPGLLREPAGKQVWPRRHKHFMAPYYVPHRKDSIAEALKS